MKIGLLTYHHSANIGAMMQTYATCRALKELGHEVVIVDIRQPERQHHGIKKIVSTVFLGKHLYDLEYFEHVFYPAMTRRYYNLEDLRNNPPQVDCLLVGSDQTWNPDKSKEVSMAYFLDFGDEKLKRISYASSFGAAIWERSEEMTKMVNEALHRFDFISVREKSGLKICNQTFGLNSQLVLDPTLLFEGYPEITGAIKQRDELLCYKLTRNNDFFNNINNVKRLINLPVRLLNNPTPVRGLRYTYPPSVKEWVQRIGGARFILTDSFHGVAFSLNYQRQFVVIRNHTIRDARFVELLEAVGLEDRIFDSVEDLSKADGWKEPINYSDVNARLNKMRESSWNYLKQALIN